MFHPAYKILKTIAHHEERETFLAKNTLTHTEVIIKALHLGELNNWKDHEQFEREVQTLRYLKHPQIPKYIDHFEVKHQGKHLFCVVIEKIDGESLAERIENGVRFHEQEAIALAKSILAPLIYLHSFSPPIIHRDLKPSNIMVDSNNTASIIDFGAMQGTSLSQDTVAGTFGYMAPEQISGRASVRSDLYNLGITLLSLLSHLSPEAMPREDLKFNLEEMINVSPWFRNWLSTLVQPLAKDRFVSAQEAFKYLHKDQNLALPLNSVLDITLHPGVLKKESRGGSTKYTIPAAYRWGSILADVLLFCCLFLAPFGGLYWGLNTFLSADYARWGNYILSPFFALSLLLCAWLGWSRLKSNLVTASLSMDEKTISLQHRWLNLFSEKAKTFTYSQVKAIDFNHDYGLLFTHLNEEESELYFEATLPERRWLESELKKEFEMRLSQSAWKSLAKHIQPAKKESFPTEDVPL